MKNNVLGAWFKELCSLIFVQTFQAFLLAIMMSIIIKALSSSKISSTGGIDAVGLLTIIALSSFSKIELLIKNIFGLTSGQGDPSLANGHRSFIGSVMALRGLKRISDNGIKMIGGAKAAVGGHVRLRKAQNQLGRLEKAEADKQQEALPSTENNEQITGNKRTIGGFRGTVGGNSEKGSLGLSSSDISQLQTELRNLTTALNKQNTNSTSKDKDDKIGKLRDAIDKAKADRKEGVRNLAKGVGETAGAITGATTGALYGLAKGDDIVSTALTGAGVGDAIGGSVTNTTVNIVSGAANITKAPKKVKEAITEEVVYQKNKKVYKQLDDDIKSKENSSIKEMNKKLDVYRKSQKVEKGHKNIEDEM